MIVIIIFLLIILLLFICIFDNRIMVIYNYCVSYFFVSVPTLCKLPDDTLGMEVAFVGYSNSGKSSVINALTHSKKLTKVGSVPGTTRYINLFEVKSGVRLVDFPGYGYSGTIKVREKYWYNVVCQYVKQRKNLKGLVLIMDFRHAIKYLDFKIIKHILTFNIPVLMLLNKADKLSKNMQKIRFASIQQKIQDMCFTSRLLQLEMCSVFKKYGIESVKKTLDIWLSV